MNPRYTVGSVTGYSDSDRGRWAVVWYVHDRLHCYRIVQRFKGTSAERQARDLARELNQQPLEKLAYPVCCRGHELTPWNVYRVPSRGSEECRTCRYDRDIARKARKKAAA